MTQEELGKTVGVGATTWSRIEQGTSQLSTEQLRAAAKTLGVSATFVMRMAEEVEEELKTKGILVCDVPPKVWIGAGLDWTSDAWRPYLDRIAAIGKVASPILIPLAGAALGGLIAKYWPDKSSENGDDTKGQ
jgi:transcriptional regulator with XRE-family HTH domain